MLEAFGSIVHDMSIMGGKACIKGTRVTVSLILAQIGGGITQEELLAEYPYLTREDISAALRYAAWVVDARESVIRTA